MKRYALIDMNSRDRPRGVVREPLMTLTEIAVALGVSQATLRNSYQHDPNRPTPEFSRSMRNAGCNGKAYFKPSLVRAWWATRAKP